MCPHTGNLATISSVRPSDTPAWGAGTGRARARARGRGRGRGRGRARARVRAIRSSWR